MMCTYAYSDSALVACACIVAIHLIHLFTVYAIVCCPACLLLVSNSYLFYISCATQNTTNPETAFYKIFSILKDTDICIQP